jgi:RND family efflux transporter MFP subunit
MRLSKSSEKGIRAFAAFLLFLGVALGAYYWLGKGLFHKGKEEALSPPPVMAKPVGPSGGVCLPAESIKFLDLSVEKAELRDLEMGIPTVGKVREDQNRCAHIRSLIPGTITQVMANLGDRVSKGQILFSLASIEVGKAKSDYLKTQADLDLAYTNLERQRRLFEANVAPRKGVQEGEIAYQIAQANMAAAHRTLHTFGLNDQEIKAINKNSNEAHALTAVIPIHSPISGTVVEKGVHIGERVAPEDELCRIVDLSSICVDAHVFERDLPEIRAEQRVMVVLSAYPKETFLGTVKYIGDIVEKETGTYIVRTIVSNPNHKLKPGMSANIRILTTRKSALVIPTEAILEEANDKFVFLKSNQSFCKQKVNVGLSSDGFTEIVSGLKRGDEIVVKGNFMLKSELAKGSLEEQRGH